MAVARAARSGRATARRRRLTHGRADRGGSVDARARRGRGASSRPDASWSSVWPSPPSDSSAASYASRRTHSSTTSARETWLAHPLFGEVLRRRDAARTRLDQLRLGLADAVESCGAVSDGDQFPRDAVAPRCRRSQPARGHPCCGGAGAAALGPCHRRATRRGARVGTRLGNGQTVGRRLVSAGPIPRGPRCFRGCTRSARNRFVARRRRVGRGRGALLSARPARRRAHRAAGCPSTRRRRASPRRTRGNARVDRWYGSGRAERRPRDRDCVARSARSTRRSSTLPRVDSDSRCGWSTKSRRARPLGWRSDRLSRCSSRWRGTGRPCSAAMCWRPRRPPIANISRPCRAGPTTHTSAGASCGA